MRRLTKRIIQRAPVRTAFTLVEMLISVALVLMLMTMFASIFQITTGSMMKQRGISENDQRARVLSTVVRKDFQHRTFRNPLAFYPGENSATSPTSFSNRAGYVYISTNDPNTGLDDLIQFTVSANVLSEDTDGTPYFGRATELVDRRIPGAVANGLAISPNQPEADDGSLSPNSVASSSAAEVCYFIRRGSLYRRVVLIREPLSVAGQNLSPQPTAQSSYNYFSGQPDPLVPAGVPTYDGFIKVNNGAFLPDLAMPVPQGTLTNDFYLLFDYSAFATIDAFGNQSTSFPGIASLSNETGGVAAELFANPSRRFGFNPFTGRSREHTVHPMAGFGPSIFLGRFTQAETSTLNFNWPQNSSRAEEPPLLLDPANPDDSTMLQVDFDFDGIADFTSVSGNPLDIDVSPLILNPGNGVVSSFDTIHIDPLTVGVEGRGGERRVEDLLLANVHEMKIELWDQRLQRFVAPGHSSVNPASGEVGDYHFSRCNNPDSGPILGFNAGATFDTWHPTAAAFDSDGVGGITLGEQSAPYVAYEFYPPLFPLGPSSTTMPDPSLERPENRGFWLPNTPYALDDVVFVPWNDAPPIGVFQYSEMEEPKFQMAYRCVVAGTSNASPPQWQRQPGRRISEALPSTVQWESFDNRRPLQSIRLTFRFQDKTSDNMRQLSLVIPMTETLN